VGFDATLFEYPFNTSVFDDKIECETEHFNFTIKKLKATSDLLVSLKSKKEYSSQGEQKDWKKFYAIMNALAFMTGVHAWPYRITYWRADQKLIDRVTAAEPLTKTLYAPFNDTLAASARTGSSSWSFPDTVKLITKFFDSESLLSQEVGYLLFLFRQAGSKDVHRDISVLSLCVLFENLVRHIFFELKLDEKARVENPAYDSFKQAKDTIIQQMDPSLVESNEGYRRMQNILRSAEAFNAKQMFKIIVNHFGLKWEGDMELILKTWNQARHPAIHQSEYATRTEDDLKESTFAESRIAGAINILLLKLFGYSGPVSESALEDKYKKI
jgi:hypothetical protein